MVENLCEPADIQLKLSETTSTWVREFRWMELLESEFVLLFKVDFCTIMSVRMIRFCPL